MLVAPVHLSVCFIASTPTLTPACVLNKTKLAAASPKNEKKINNYHTMNPY